MRDGPVRLALFALLVLVFLLLPTSGPAAAVTYGSPPIIEDGSDQYRPNLSVTMTFTDGERSVDHVDYFLPTQVNDPPEVRIESPAHGREFLQGDGIVMVFVIDDPDDSDWQLRWEVSGLTNGYEEQIDYIPVNDKYIHNLDGVPLGEYHLTVYVRDREYQDTASVEFMVVSEYTESSSAGASPWWYWFCCISSFLVIVPISYYLVKRRQASIERSRAARIQTPAGGPLTTSPPPKTSYPQVHARPSVPPPLLEQVPPTIPAPYPMDGRKAEPPPAYAPREIEPPPPPPPPPPPTPPAPTQAVVEDWRVGSVEEFVDLIPELPEGFPEPLWGIDWWTLGREVVSTSELRRDGLPVCTVNGRQFHADKRDMDTFMQEVED